MRRTAWLPQAVILVGCLLCIGLALNIASIHARTPPKPPGIPKPDDFVIHLPWTAGRAVSIGHSYGQGEHDNKDMYALDFFIEQGSGGASGHEKDVHTIASGTVLWADWYQGASTWKCLGNSVAIAHEGAGASYVSFYAHLESIDQSVDVGKPINQGAVIGTVGNTGSGALGCETFDSHLHFVLYKDADTGTLQNPHPPDNATPVGLPPVGGAQLWGFLMTSRSSTDRW
jgi:hypothetical protein